MPFKPVGVDENGNLPSRVMRKLSESFVMKPDDLLDGQVPVWNAATKSWRAASLGSDNTIPTKIDGGTPDI